MTVTVTVNDGDGGQVTSSFTWQASHFFHVVSGNAKAKNAAQS